MIKVGKMVWEMMMWCFWDGLIGFVSFLLEINKFSFIGRVYGGIGFYWN